MDKRKFRKYGNEKLLLSEALVNLKDAVSLLRDYLKVDENDLLKVLSVKKDEEKELKKHKKLVKDKCSTRVQYLENKGYIVKLRGDQFVVFRRVKRGKVYKLRRVGYIRKKDAHLFVRVNDDGKEVYRYFKSLKHFILAEVKEQERSGR